MLRHHRIYVEPFAGGAAVYFRKDASEKEVLNDKDAEIAFAFRFLAQMTPEQFKKLKRRNWIKAEARFKRLKNSAPQNDLSRFYRFYYLKRASFCRGGKTFSYQDEGGVINIDHLWNVHQRLKNTRVHNTTALKMIDKYDSPETLFYLDPPYPGRAFVGASFKEYTVEDLQELIEKLKGIRGKFILSLGTEHQKYLPPAWRVRRLKLRRNIQSGGKGWNQGVFQYEIVAGNYNFDRVANAHRHRGRVKTVILRGKTHSPRIKLTKNTEIEMIKPGRRRYQRLPKGVYSHPSQVPGVLFKHIGQ